MTGYLKRYKGFGVTMGELNFGTLRVLTLEEPWRDNVQKVSCIPDGEYVCEVVHSDHLGFCVAVNDVPGRSLIRIHAGNTLEDTEGCILVGDSLVVDQTGVRLLNSRKTLDRLLEWMEPGKKYTLVIEGGSA